MDSLPSTSGSTRLRRVRASDISIDFVVDTLLEIEEDVAEVDVDDSDDDPDYIITSDHDSSTDQEIDENEGLEYVSQESESREKTRTDSNDQETETSLVNRKKYFYGKQTLAMKKKNILPFKWKKDIPTQTVRTRQHNIVTFLPGLRPAALAIGNNPDALAVWNLLFSNDILDEILKWTNKKILNLRARYQRQNLSYIQYCDMIELKAFIGLLVYTAVFKSGNESVHSLYATDGTGREIFRYTMSKERFLFLLTCLRFDNPEDRKERKDTDRATAVSRVFNKFIDNSRNMYTPGAYLCIDEMLIPFRGRCKFKMYMPKKPAKYGLKVQCLTDAKTHYLLNAYIYTGKGSDGETLTDHEKNMFLIPTQAVLRLSEPYVHTNRNITTDNWYTSIELSKELLDRGLTTVGTLKKNKTEIPQQFLPNKVRKENDCIYGFTENLTILSFVPQQNKAVLMLSSMHHSKEDDLNTGKPEIIACYNQTKGGVDTVDQLCANYNCSRRTRRWPMAIFFTMVNVSAGVNGYILHQSYKNNTRMTRMEFMKNLAMSLVIPHMTQRLNHGNLGVELKLGIKRVLRIEEDSAPEREEFFEKRKRCSYCPPRLGRKTKYPCKICSTPICLECSHKVCKDCLKKKLK